MRPHALLDTDTLELRPRLRRATEARDVPGRVRLVPSQRHTPSSRAIRGRVAVAVPRDAQRVVVKARIVKPHMYRQTSFTTATQRHLAYLERDGVELDGMAGTLYTRDVTEVDRAVFLARSAGDPHQFRVIDSPERAQDLDLTSYTRALMARMAQDLGTPLDWVAVNHYNTDNPHTHVVLRGVDLHGRALRIDRDYLAQGLRGRAQELATRELGRRTSLEIEQAWQREVAQERFTSLDRTLRERSPDGVLRLEHLGSPSTSLRQQQRLTARLHTLETLGLVAQDPQRTWHFTPGWERTLRDLGTRYDILATMQRALHSDPARYHILDPRDSQQRPVVGHVVGRGLADELHDREYLLVATARGTTHYVPLAPGQTLEHVGPGTTVRVTVAPTRDLDSVATRNVLAYTRETGGLYDARQHEAWARHHVTVPGDRYPAYVTAHVQRVERLEALGLAERVGPQQWRVPEDLEQRIRQLPEAQRQARPPAMHVRVLDGPDLARQRDRDRGDDDDLRLER